MKFYISIGVILAILPRPDSSPYSSPPIFGATELQTNIVNKIDYIGFL